MTHNTKLKDDIIESLSLGPRSLPILVNSFSLQHNISIQAVYKMFRLLKKEEIISIHSKQASLSLIWTAQQKEKYAFTEHSYKGIMYIKNLTEGKVNHVTFVFKTLNELELFWTHVYTLIAENINPTLPSYSIQPHDWYPYSRVKTSNYWETRHKQSKRVLRFVVTHTLPLDKVVLKNRKGRQGKLIDYVFNHNPLKQKENTYYNLISDFIFKATFDEKIASKLNSFIKNNSTLPLSKDSQENITKILGEKGKFSLTIYKSQAKANIIEKKVKKFFE